MEQIPELLRTRMEYVQTIVDKSSRYLEIVRDIMLGINPTAYKQVNADIDLLRTLIKEIPLITVDTTNVLCSMMILYEKIVTLENCFESIMAMFDNQTYAKLAVYNMSSTYTTNIYHERNTAVLAHEKYTDASARDDDTIFDIVFGAFTEIDNVFTFVIDNEKTVNKFTIKLINWIIQRTTGERRRRVELIIEKQKDLLLGSTRVDLSAFPGVQGVLYRYNLRPVTISMQIAELFNQLSTKYNTKLSIDENFAVLAQGGPGVIAINKSTPSPVEFNLEGLINLEYVTAHDFKTNPLSGLTKKVIERFNTAKLLPRGPVSEPVRKFAGKSNTWYVFESINGDMWRLLGKRGEKVIPGDAITGLVKGLTTRPHQYHTLQTNTILTRCFDEKAKMLLADYEEEKVALPSSEPIRTEIVDRLTRGFEATLDNNPVKNSTDFREIVIDNVLINEVLLDVLTHSTGIYGKGSDEYLITYIAKFDGIIRAFIKELERRWDGEDISDRLFKEYSREELKRILMTIFKSVVKSSVDELDRSKTWTDYDLTLKEFFLERKQAII